VIKIIKARGTSMLPAIDDGDYLITTKPRRLMAGLIYIIDHIDLGRIVKRLERLEGEHAYFSGDNKASTPQSLIGKVEQRRITGRVILIVGKTGARRPSQH